MGYCRCFLTMEGKIQMKFKIVHEMKGRMRIHMSCNRMSLKDADILQYYLMNQASVSSAKVYERNQDVVISYIGKRKEIIHILQQFSFDKASVPEHVWQNSGRETSRRYWDKVVQKIVLRVGSKVFLPVPVRNIFIACKSVK